MIAFFAIQGIVLTSAIQNLIADNNNLKNEAKIISHEYWTNDIFNTGKLPC